MTIDERMALLYEGVERADQHVHDLYAVTRTFLHTRPYVVRSKVDAELGQCIYEIGEVTSVPVHISRLVGDAAGVLRGTLNRLAYQCFALHNPGKKGKHIRYPISDSVEEYPTVREGQVEGLPDYVIDAIDATKPYFGGYGAFWGIKSLHEIDQHAPIQLGGMCTNIVRRSRDRRAFSSEFLLDRPVRALIAGQELARLPLERDAHEDVDFAFDITITEIKVPQAYPVVETMQSLTDAVRHVLRAFRPLLG